MREMYWDDELAKGAQDWANHCEFEHNLGHERKVARFDVGQNLGISRSIGRRDNEMRAEFSKHIKTWFDENEQFKFAPISGAGGTGHYTQVIWADTYLVGCGYVRYKEGATMGQFYVCNYGPAGNMLTKQPYDVGKQKCGNELVKSKTYRGLCAMREPPSSQCSSKGKSALRLLSGRKKKSHASKKCKGSECFARRAMSTFENVEVNDTDSNLKKVYNLITINVFH
ncbi:hypothetical protein TSAR_008826 [Trichomalopsis sarcophagae]|uniref:SCP domain-containing protein n=1 Tax=Trichomalopsis sarcophagae TaxID=543379 RepID=A0A232F8W1_9HYME|nr:hypothetical protein TSAR_008826 [Trichomalopsis sarcophagae]